MIDVMKVASYICKRYMDETKTKIDEMKLHKLMYFTQRESIIQTGEPMFDAPFQAWKYGPVLVQIRDGYKSDTLTLSLSDNELAQYIGVFDFVFSNYAKKDSWSLSMLTHGESSWQNARKGIAQDEPCSAIMSMDDIRNDAQRIKMRRFFFNEIQPKLNENN